MKIEAWLKQAGIADPDFADRIGVSRQALWRYKAGIRTPRPAVLVRIREATDGHVSANDFLAPAPSHEAAE